MWKSFRTIAQTADPSEWDWLTETLAEAMDVEYIDSISGDMRPLRAVKRVYHRLGESEVLTIPVIAARLYDHYGTAIARQHAVIEIEYAPAENYNMTESVNEMFGQGSSGSATVNTDANRYGFNTTTAGGVPTEHTTGSTTTSNRVDSGRDVTTTRSGNIGVTTSQQMIQSEIDLWRNYDLIEFMFDKLDNILILEVF